jgi:hypothetical protein
MEPNKEWRNSFFWKWIWPALLGYAVSLLCFDKSLHEVAGMFLLLVLLILFIYYR